VVPSWALHENMKNVRCYIQPSLRAPGLVSKRLSMLLYTHTHMHACTHTGNAHRHCTLAVQIQAGTCMHTQAMHTGIVHEQCTYRQTQALYTSSAHTGRYMHAHTVTQSRYMHIQAHTGTHRHTQVEAQRKSVLTPGTKYLPRPKAARYFLAEQSAC
jgi:hypothetical protein